MAKLSNTLLRLHWLEYLQAAGSPTTMLSLRRPRVGTRTSRPSETNRCNLTYTAFHMGSRRTTFDLLIYCHVYISGNQLQEQHLPSPHNTFNGIPRTRTLLWISMPHLSKTSSGASAVEPLKSLYITVVSSAGRTKDPRNPFRPAPVSVCQPFSLRFGTLLSPLELNCLINDHS